MSKKDIFNKIVAGISLYNPAVGAAIKGGEAGVEALIHRDDDPTNDVDETIDAVTDIAINAIMGIENIAGKDYVNDPVVAQLAANIKGDLKLLHLLRVK